MADQVELIICDGGSTDNSVEIIQKYANGLPPNTPRAEWHPNTQHPTTNSPCVTSNASKAETLNSKLQTLNTQSPTNDQESTANDSNLISWWCSEKDKGQSDAFNKGFSHAKGKFFSWLNADDVMLPGVLATVINFINRYPYVEWVSGGMAFCDADMKIMQMRIGTAPPPFLPVKFLSMTIIGGPSSFFAAKRFREVGGFDVHLKYAMDGDLWWRLFMAGTKLYHVRQYFWAFRLHEKSKTSPALLKKHLGDNHAIENAYLTTKNPRPRWMALVGVKVIAFWKLLNGSIIKSLLDTYRHKGLPIENVFE